MKYKRFEDLFKYRENIAERIYAEDLKNSALLAGIEEKYLEDTIYTIRFLANSLMVDEPLVFINYMKWFGDLAYYLKFNMDSMTRHFDVSISIFKELFVEDLFNKIIKVYNEGISVFIKAYNSEKKMEFQYDEFISYLIDMESEKAYKYIEDRISEGMSLKDIYLKILQPTLYNVGTLWQQRVISVAKEHYITALIQHIIGRMYSVLFSEKRDSKYSVTAVCAGNELHEIGMRMVADFFEMDGWDSVFLGSNLPVDLVIEHLHKTPSDLLAISVTTSSQIIEVKNLISRLKKDEILANIKILVGGRAFNDAPDLWKKVSADGYAQDAEQALVVGRLLVGENFG